jgi:hypothetical protein
MFHLVELRLPWAGAVSVLRTSRHASLRSFRGYSLVTPWSPTSSAHVSRQPRSLPRQVELPPGPGAGAAVPQGIAQRFLGDARPRPSKASRWATVSCSSRASPRAASSWLRMSRPLSSRSSSSARFNAVMSVWVMTARTPRRRDRARRPRQRGRELQRQRQHQCRAEQASTSSSHHFSCNPTVTGSNAALAQMPIRAPDVDGGRRIEVAMVPHPVRYPL